MRGTWFRSGWARHVLKYNLPHAAQAVIADLSGKNARGLLAESQDDWSFGFVRAQSDQELCGVVATVPLDGSSWYLSDR